MYTNINFKTKKQLKEAVLKRVKWLTTDNLEVIEPPPITVYQPGLGPNIKSKGWFYVEGPQYPEAHTWYAEVFIVNCEITKVR